MPVETPDYLVGVGSSGSRIVEWFMQKEWVIEDTLLRGADDGDASLQARTVDSATGAHERDARQRARENIIELIKEHKSDEYGTVSFEHYNYVTDTAEGILSPEVLRAESDVEQRIFPGTERLNNCWWLTDDPELLTDAFDNGTQRRRALGKALYHVSAGHANNPDDHPANLDVGAGDSVVIVVALGGGTGSGSFTDLAVDMHDNARISLFAIMPDAGNAGGMAEGMNELANAYAALSELEYMKLAGESPFRDITLVPYLNRHDIHDGEFEDAVVHSILAHQGAMSIPIPRGGVVPGGGRYTPGVQLVPGRNWAISRHHTFKVAVPRIIQYVGIRQEARKDVEAYLEEREQQLAVERGLYETVEQFLRRDFPDSFGITLDRHDVAFDEDDSDQAYAVFDMAARLERDLQGTLLENRCIKAAGLNVDEIKHQIEQIYDWQYELTDGDGPAYERVQCDTDNFQYADDIADLLSQSAEHLQSEQNSTALDEQLVNVVRTEMENVGMRYDLLKSIHATETVDGLDGERTELVKTALTEVVLDPKIRNRVSVFPNKEVERMRDDCEAEIHDGERTCAQLDQFEMTVTEELQHRLTDWWAGVEDELGCIINYAQHRGEIETLLAELQDICEHTATQLSDPTTPAVDPQLAREVDIEQLNGLLEAVCAEKRIRREELAESVETLVRAKRAHEEYHETLSILNVFQNNQEEFDAAKHDANRLGWFEITTTSIDDQFNVECRWDHREVLDHVDAQYDAEVTSVIETLEGVLRTGDGELQQFRLADVVDMEEVKRRVTEQGSTRRPAEFDDGEYVDCSVPGDDSQVREAFDRVERTLRTIDGQTVTTNADLARALGMEAVLEGEIRADRAETPVDELIAAYLAPIQAERRGIPERLEQLGSAYETDDDGLYQALERLIVLADEHHDAADRHVSEMPPDEAYYGPDFTMRFERENYNVSSSGREYEKTTNAVMRTRSASARDLVGNPSDIAESDIWAENEDDIVAAFRQSIRDIKDGRYGRLPVDLHSLNPPEGSQVPLAFEELRLLNVFMSRAFETSWANSNAGPQSVREESTSDRLSLLLHPHDGYMDMMYGHGDDWTLSMITFVNGFTLDMLEPVTGDRGYKQAYERQTERATYPWRHHSLGLAGDWDRWEVLADSVTAEENPEWWPHGGAYVRRDELLSPSEICAWTKKLQHHDRELTRADVRRRMLDKYKIDGFRSTVNSE